MKDLIGQEINLYDFVAGSAYQSQVQVFSVVGFTPQKVRLRSSRNMTYLKLPTELVVIPGAENYLTPTDTDEEQQG